MSKTIEKIAREHGATTLYKQALGSRATCALLHDDISDADIADVAASRTMRRDGGTTTVVGAAVDVDPETGKINITVPMSASAPAAGYARCKALQSAKKDLLRIRMQEKLLARRLAAPKVESP